MVHGVTRVGYDLATKLPTTKRTFHAKIGTIKDRNVIDLRSSRY